MDDFCFTAHAFQVGYERVGLQASAGVIYIVTRDCFNNCHSVLYLKGSYRQCVREISHAAAVPLYIFILSRHSLIIIQVHLAED